tara:strand:- start:2336 stop:2866 length:531 start_codon:yes stop_codon:yes gene_type:complete
MELTVPNESKGSRSDYEQLAGGTYEGICIDAIYPVVKQFQNEKPRQCVIFVFELNENRKRKDGEADDSRYQVWSNSMTLTLHSMGTLKPFLESWLGREMEVNDKLILEELVGKSAKLTVNLKKKRNKPDEKYVNIAAVLPGEEGSFEASDSYERKDPVDYSDVKPSRDEVKEGAPF